MAKKPQRYQLTVDGHDYEVLLTTGLSSSASVNVDGEETSSTSSVGERTRLDAGPGASVLVLCTGTGRPRRVTLRAGGRELDLEPEPGSPAARRLERERAHPVLTGFLDVLLAATGALIAVLGIGALLEQWLAPVIRWVASLLEPPFGWLRSLLPDVDWPSIDLPSIPLPHLDLPDWTPPGWLEPVLDNSHYVSPLIVAAFAAWWDARRRRRQDELKSSLAATPQAESSPSQPTSQRTP